MRYLQKLLMAVLLVMCTLTGTPAQAYNGSMEDVTVTGSVYKEVAPDMALLNFTVLGQGKNADEAAAEAAAKMAEVRRALLGVNILSEQTEQVSYSLQPQYNDKGQISGYQAANTVKVTIESIDKAGAVIDRLAGAGIDRIGSLEFSVKNKDLLQRQLLAEAVENARQQAGILANAGGRSLGRMLSAKTVSYSAPTRMYNAMDTLAKAAATEIAAANIKVSANVEAVFALQ